MTHSVLPKKRLLSDFLFGIIVIHLTFGLIWYFLKNTSALKFEPLIHKVTKMSVHCVTAFAILITVNMSYGNIINVFYARAQALHVLI